MPDIAAFGSPASRAALAAQPDDGQAVATTGTCRGERPTGPSDGALV